MDSGLLTQLFDGRWKVLSRVTITNVRLLCTAYLRRVRATGVAEGACEKFWNWMRGRYSALTTAIGVK